MPHLPQETRDRSEVAAFAQFVYIDGVGAEERSDLKNHGECIYDTRDELMMLDGLVMSEDEDIDQDYSVGVFNQDNYRMQDGYCARWLSSKLIVVGVVAVRAAAAVS